jgi:hypothetical protein
MIPSSVADRSLRVPPKVPKPVRTPDKNTISSVELISYSAARREENMEGKYHPVAPGTSSKAI